MVEFSCGHMLTEQVLFSSNDDAKLCTVNAEMIHMNTNIQKKLLCLSFAVLLAVPVLTMTVFNAAASPADPSAATAYSGAGPRGNDYNPVIDQAGFDQNSRAFHIQVDNRGGSDEWVGMRVYYYKQVNYGPGYELIGQGRLQAASDGGRMMRDSDMHSGGSDTWIRAQPGHSYYLSCGQVPQGATWVVYGAPWYADGNHHGWTGSNGPFGDMNEHLNVYRVE